MTNLKGCLHCKQIQINSALCSDSHYKIESIYQAGFAVDNTLWVRSVCGVDMTQYLQCGWC